MSDTTRREARAARPSRLAHIFDIVFKRLLQEASPQAVIAMVNGLFDTDFPPDSPVFFPNKEKVTEENKLIISDMMILIGEERFHIEAQIDDDLNMALRMFQYGYHEAVTHAKRSKNGNLLTLSFPQARVLYFETTKKTPDKFSIRMNFPDRSSHTFTIPAFKVLEHDIKELEQQQLALLLPFYMLKYRKQVQRARSSAKRQALAPGMKTVMENLLDAAQDLREAGILTEEDESFIIGEVKLLYASLYEPYEEFKEAQMTIDERYENPYLKAKREAREEGEARGIAKVARNMLQAGVSRDIIFNTTGLNVADLEKTAAPARNFA